MRFRVHPAGLAGAGVTFVMASGLFALIVSNTSRQRALLEALKGNAPAVGESVLTLGAETRSRPDRRRTPHSSIEIHTGVRCEVPRVSRIGDPIG